MDIEILSNRFEVQPFIDSVRAAADTERKSFGFLPKRAYGEFALQERLLVAVNKVDRTFAGYLAFGGVPPQARIFQTYVDPKYRGYGIGDDLIKNLVERLEKDSYLSIRASIADDLVKAKEFYRRNGFRPRLAKSGGKSTNRMITVHVRELSTPSLLDACAPEPIMSSGLSIHSIGTQKRSLYLIDLNVVFDLTKRRANALGAGRVFAAAMANEIELAISDEFISELERNWTEGPDPTLEMCSALPRFRLPSSDTIAQIRSTIAPVLFPARWEQNRLTVQDESDIRHLATVIAEGADGWVTSEKAHLVSAQWFKDNFGISIVSPDVIGKSLDVPDKSSVAYQIKLGSQHFRVSDAQSEDHPKVRDFLRALGVADQVTKNALKLGTTTAPRRQLVAFAGANVIAFASWSPTTVRRRTSRLYLFVDEGSPFCSAVVDRFVDLCARDVSAMGPARIEVNIPADHDEARAQSVRCGFRPLPGEGAREGKLEKVCLGGVATQSAWPKITDEFRSVTGLRLPTELPRCGSLSEVIELFDESGRRIETSISVLEDCFSPALIVGKDRDCVIAPIKPRFAESLFQGTLQPSFLDDPQGSLLTRKRYFSDARAYSTMPEGGLLVFYESMDGSRGRGAAIAICRISRRYVSPEDKAKKLSVERGVLSDHELAKISQGRDVCVTEFDNLLHFSNPIGLDQLKSIGCADGRNVVTAKPLSTEALNRLLELGKPHV